jgi:hypothetical protein
VSGIQSIWKEKGIVATHKIAEKANTMPISVLTMPNFSGSVISGRVVNGSE